MQNKKWWEENENCRKKQQLKQQKINEAMDD